MTPSHYRTIFLSSLLAKIYDLWVWIAVLGRTKKLRANVFPFIPGNAKIMVDFAAGTAENAIAVKKRFPQMDVFAVDLSEPFLKIGIKKAKAQGIDIKFSVADVTKTPYKSDFAGFVLISFALHDIPQKQRLLVLREARRILKKGGVFAIYDYNRPKSPIVQLPLWIQFLLAENRDAYDFLDENWQQHLKDAGFKDIIRKTYYKGLAQIVAGRK